MRWRTGTEWHQPLSNKFWTPTPPHHHDLLFHPCPTPSALSGHSHQHGWAKRCISVSIFYGPKMKNACFFFRAISARLEQKRASGWGHEVKPRRQPITSSGGNEAAAQCRVGPGCQRWRKRIHSRCKIRVDSSGSGGSIDIKLFVFDISHKLVAH